MKKFTIILVALAVSAGSFSAHGQGAPKPNFGAKGGLNFANIIGDEADNSMKTAFHVGVYSEVFFDYFLMMQAELLLSYQGHAKANESSNALNLWYINLPIMARYNLGYNFNVHLGLQPGFLIGANSSWTDFNGEEQKDDVIDQKKTFDLGIPVGAGYTFWDRRLNATVRYVIPLMNTEKSDFETKKNSVFQISIGIKIMTVD